MYYEIRPGIYADLGVVRDPIPRPGRFALGRVIEEPQPDPMVFSVDNTDDSPPRGMEGISVPVWATALVECLRAAGIDNLQTFPAILRNDETGREWSNYLAVNVLGVISCMSKSSKASRIANRPGGTPFVKVHKLVIDPRLAQNAPLFRLAESPGVLLIRDVFIEALKEAAPPEGWGITAKPVAESEG